MARPVIRLGLQWGLRGALSRVRFSQGLKPLSSLKPIAARLKSCPDTKQFMEQAVKSLDHRTVSARLKSCPDTKQFMEQAVKPLGHRVFGMTEVVP